MSNVQAVCFRCGHAKGSALATCPACTTAPKTLEERAKSYLLTRTFYDGQRDYGKDDAELDRLATRLQQGGDIDYDASELAAMTASLSAADATTPREMILGTAKWLVPVVALLAIVLFVARSGGGMHV